MTDYMDKVLAGDQPKTGPEVLPDNDNPRFRLEAVAPAPEIDGVPCSLEEKGFHEDALAVLAGEENVRHPTAKEMQAWHQQSLAMAEERRRRIRQELAIEQLLTASHLSIGNTESALASLTKDDLTPAIQDKLYTLFYWAGRAMERAAVLAGAEYTAPMSLGALIDETNSNRLRANLQKSVELARSEKRDA